MRVIFFVADWRIISLMWWGFDFRCLAEGPSPPSRLSSLSRGQLVKCTPVSRWLQSPISIAFSSDYRADDADDFSMPSFFWLMLIMMCRSCDYAPIAAEADDSRSRQHWWWCAADDYFLRLFSSLAISLRHFSFADFQHFLQHFRQHFSIISPSQLLIIISAGWLRFQPRHCWCCHFRWCAFFDGAFSFSFRLFFSLFAFLRFRCRFSMGPMWYDFSWCEPMPETLRRFRLSKYFAFDVDADVAVSIFLLITLRCAFIDEDFHCKADEPRCAFISISFSMTRASP